jgi:hypothetical protein
MDGSSFKIYLGSVPGNLSQENLAFLLKQQVASFFAVEVTRSDSIDRIVQNKGFAFMTLTDPEEYSAIIKHEKRLQIEGRIISTDKYRSKEELRAIKYSSDARKIFITNMPDCFTEEQLMATLRSAGLQPELAFPAKKSSTQENYRFGIAQFSDTEQVKIALRLGGAAIPGLNRKYLMFRKYDKKSKGRVAFNPPNRLNPSKNKECMQQYSGLASKPSPHNYIPNNRAQQRQQSLNERGHPCLGTQEELPIGQIAKTDKDFPSHDSSIFQPPKSDLQRADKQASQSRRREDCFITSEGSGCMQGHKSSLSHHGDLAERPMFTSQSSAQSLKEDRGCWFTNKQHTQTSSWNLPDSKRVKENCGDKLANPLHAKLSERYRVDGLVDTQLESDDSTRSWLVCMKQSNSKQYPRELDARNLRFNIRISPIQNLS